MFCFFVCFSFPCFLCFSYTTSSLLITGKEEEREQCKRRGASDIRSRGGGGGDSGGNSEAIRAEHPENVARASAQGTILNRHARADDEEDEEEDAGPVRAQSKFLTFQDSGSPNHTSPQLPRASLVDFSRVHGEPGRLILWFCHKLTLPTLEYTIIYER